MAKKEESPDEQDAQIKLMAKAMGIQFMNRPKFLSFTVDDSDGRCGCRGDCGCENVCGCEK